MKKKNKIVKIVAILVLIIFVIGTGLYIKRRNNYIYITQFSPTNALPLIKAQCLTSVPAPIIHGEPI